jgi:hypothetical protein
MEVFQENYAKIYNFIISKKELKFYKTSVLLPHAAIEQFYETFKKLNKEYVNFNTREEIKSHFPKILKKIDLAYFNFLVIPKNTLSCKSLYNYFKDDAESKEIIVNTIIELLISSSVYKSMINIKESITISNELDNADKEFLSMMLSKVETLMKSKNLVLLRDLIKYFCDYISKHPDILLRLGDDINNIIKPYLSNLIGDDNSEPCSKIVCEILTMLPEHQVKEFENWLEVFNKPEDFETIPEIMNMINKIIEYENFGLQVTLPNHIINFLTNEKNINSIYTLLYIFIESITLLGHNNRAKIINDILNIYKLPNISPNLSQNEQLTILLELFHKIKDTENIIDTFTKYYEEYGRQHLQTLLNQINRKYNTNYKDVYIEKLFKLLLDEMIKEENI